MEDTWYRRTALADMLGVKPDKVNDSRLYRTLDMVLPLKDKIEMHLKQRIGELFAPDFDLVLYDVTTVEEIVQWMEGKYGRARRVWVMDRGMVSESSQKERAIHQRFVQRIESGLTRLDQELANAGKARDRGVIKRRIGRLLGTCN